MRYKTDAGDKTRRGSGNNLTRGAFGKPGFAGRTKRVFLRRLKRLFNKF